ncbi:MAG: Fis family transcriptional regulator [bacterium]|nr:Fis family transcriptional regulator [bacterium]
MSAEIFTNDWALLWGEQINSNTDYKKAAERWEGAIGLVMSADDEMGITDERIVIADLWHGDCRGAIAADESALEETPFVITAPPRTWGAVLGGSTDPIVGLVGGKLKLTRGGLFALLPYAKAAKELVRSAGNVDTCYPEGWED